MEPRSTVNDCTDEVGVLVTYHLSQALLLNSTTLGPSLTGFGGTLQVHSVMLEHREGKEPQVRGVLAQSFPGTVRMSKVLLGTEPLPPPPTCPPPAQFCPVSHKKPRQASSK